jgi:hypothetical protein
VGRLAEARETAEEAVRLAYATQQASERPRADELLRRLTAPAGSATVLTGGAAVVAGVAAGDGCPAEASHPVDSDRQEPGVPSIP